MEVDAETRQKPDLALWAYNLALVLLSPLVLLWVLWRILIRGKSRAGLAERLGFLPDAVAAPGRSGDPVVWFHAVSVGEVAALQPILDAFRLKEPVAQPVLSTTTPTGRQMAQKQALEVEALFYFPFDLLPSVRRTLDTVNPSVLALVEGEIWPNLLAMAAHRGVKTCLINGRISDEAFARARLLRPLYRWMLRKVNLLCVQSDTDRHRFLALGALPERVRVLGNSKFDERFPAVSDAEAAQMRQEFGFGDDDPVLVAGSTHPGEEKTVLAAFSRLRPEFGTLQLVLAPRHPERGDQIHELVEKFGFQVYRRSHARNGHPQPQPIGPQARVVILDTIGELARVYAIASVVFVGGSLVRTGGHNVLQPIAQGKAVITGPHTHNFRGIMTIAQQAGAVEVVRNGEEMAKVTARLLRSPQELAARRERGLAMLEDQRGASERMAQVLTDLLDAGAQLV